MVQLNCFKLLKKPAKLVRSDVCMIRESVHLRELLYYSTSQQMKQYIQDGVIHNSANSGLVI